MASAAVQKPPPSLPLSTPIASAPPGGPLTPSPAIASINHLLLLRASALSSQPILGVPKPSSDGAYTPGVYTTYTFGDIYLRAARLARWLVRSGMLHAREKGEDAREVVVALLAPSGWEYVVLEMAVVRLGWCCCFFSTNNSPAALASLLDSTRSTHLFYDRASPHLLAAAQEARASSQTTPLVTLLPTPDPLIAYEDPSVELVDADAPAYRSALFGTPAEAPDAAFCVHSSGSTGHPKPIWISHKAMLANVSNNFDLPAFVTLPLFHNHGHSALYRALYSKRQLWLYPTPPLPLTAGGVVAALRASGAALFYAVPYVLKLLSETQEGTAALRSLQLATFGGSACPDEVGDKLVREGVRLVGHYGTTEVGQLMTSKRDYDNDKEWNWLRSSSNRSGNEWFKDYVIWEPLGDGTFELIVKAGWPPQTQSNRPDGGYATKDLFIRHPTRPDAWKYVGRRDDTLVHATGEKTSPVPIELALRESPLLDDAVVFGSGRMQAGALLMLAAAGMPARTPGASAGWSTADEDAARTRVWPAVTRANRLAPTHSRLLPEMVRVLPAGAPFPRADKGSIVRARVYAQHARLIDETYMRFEGGGGDAGGEKRRPESEQEMRRFVGEVVASTIGAGDKNCAELGLKDQDDLPARVGLNSLQAARVRNVLQRDLDLGGTKLTSNVVFENPTISQLAEHLLAVRDGRAPDTKADPHAVMRALVSSHAAALVPNPRPAPTYTPLAARAVLLTGATGSLGAHLLDRLLQRPEVRVVYCLCRAEGDGGARERVEESLRHRKLRPLEGRGREVICLSSDVEKEFLGLGEERYEEIVDAVTDVIHNAWPVNFNMTVESFEGQIAGARSLMNLCLQHGTKHGSLPASFFFSSSISAVVNSKEPVVSEDFSDDPSTAQNIGYARSKWVVEQLCKRAAQDRSLRAHALRIGQMVGDSEEGVWQTTEALPLMFKSAQTVGVLPELQEEVSWLPVDIAAQTVVELVLSPDNATLAAVHNILNPRTAPWSSILDSLGAAGLQFTRVPTPEWLARLHTADDVDPEAARENPVLKLRQFFEEKYGAREGQARRPRLETARTERLAPALAEARAPDGALVGKIVTAWKEVGFLQ